MLCLIEDLHVLVIEDLGMNHSIVRFSVGLQLPGHLQLDMPISRYVKK